MAGEPLILERIRNIFAAKGVEWVEKRMFGGDCFLIDDKMCLGTYRGGLLLRIDPEEENVLAEKPFVSRMIHGGRVMKGYLSIEPRAYLSDIELEFWVAKCLDFNPKAKSSKQK